MSSGSGRRGKTGHRTMAGKTVPAWGLEQRRKIFSMPAAVALEHATRHLERIKQKKKKEHI